MLYITIGIVLVHFVDLGIGKRRDMSYLRDLRRVPILAIGLFFVDSLLPVCQSTRGIRTGLEGHRLSTSLDLLSMLVCRDVKVDWKNYFRAVCNRGAKDRHFMSCSNCIAT